VRVLYFGDGHTARILLVFNAVLEDVDNFFDVFGPKLVLLLALSKLAIRIDDNPYV
jgi:hypothetical protein